MSSAFPIHEQPSAILNPDSAGPGEARFRAFVNASTDIIYRMSPDWSEMRELDGRGLVDDALSPRRDWIDNYVIAEDQPKVLAAIGNAIATKATFELEHRVRRVDGSIGWVASRAVPILDAAGETVEWFGAASDITARQQALAELAAVTAAAEAQKRLYEALISSTPDLVYAFDREYRFIFANRALLEMWGRSLEQSIGLRLIEVGYEPWHAEMHEREIDQVVATRQPIRGEVGFPHATLGWRIYDYIFTPIFDATGEVSLISGTTRDITDIKRAEQHLQLLINELNHRVKNTLATIQSLAAQTFRGGAATPEARAAFEARLMALSEAHTVLTMTNWESANIHDIAMRAIAPFQPGGPPRIHVAGPDCLLRPQAALALAMAIHELASNAVKYGAITRDEGQIDLDWHVEDGSLVLSWRERGGPAVSVPQRRGFGSRLIERGLVNDLGGVARLDFAPTGVVCHIAFPLAEAIP